MKKTIFMSLIVLILLSLNGYAQDQIKIGNGEKGRKEKIFKKKLLFLKKNLKLDEKESDKFEGVFKQYSQRKLALRKAYNSEIIKKVKKVKLKDLSEEDKQKVINRKMELDKQLYELDAGFIKKLTQILPPEKVIRYFILERKFKEKLMKRVVNRKKMMQHRKEMIQKRKEMIQKRKRMGHH